MHGPDVIVSAVVYLAAAVVAVPLAQRLGFGSVLGYLGAGIAIGPWGLGLVEDPQQILGFAELGVVLLLFLIGLELEPARLWQLRRPLLGSGGLQVAVTTALLFLATLLLGLDWRAALTVGMALSLSSTAIALQTLGERNLLATPAGRTGFAILLLQDIAVIPMLALIPLLGPGGGGGAIDWTGTLKALAVVAAIVLGGNLLTRPIFRRVAATGLREVFTAFALLLVLGIALLMQAVGLSMALGTFLAGVLLAKSEYRHALETDIEPFKGLLLGLFFIAVGMSVDFARLLERPLAVLGAVTGLVLVKSAVLWALARLADLPARQHPLFAFVLAQGGEFAFVLMTVAASSGAVSAETRELVVLVVALSMVTTPLLMLVEDRLLEPRLATVDRRPADPIDEQSPVIIAGFGRFGQVVGRLLHANGIATTILDHDPDRIETVRRFGFKVFYGDARRLDLLRAAGAERAHLLVLAVDDRERALAIVDVVRDNFPKLRILARAWDVVHAFDLRDRGVETLERATFESALRLGEASLRQLGFEAYQARRAANRFRAHDERTLDRLYGLYHEDLTRRIGVATEARRELQALFEADESALRDHADAEWSGQGTPAGPSATVSAGAKLAGTPPAGPAPTTPGSPDADPGPSRGAVQAAPGGSLGRTPPRG
jgi:glutathione-regulated potassium-efflux system ancillary protein KefC